MLKIRKVIERYCSYFDCILSLFEAHATGQSKKTIKVFLQALHSMLITTLSCMRLPIEAYRSNAMFKYDT